LEEGRRLGGWTMWGGSSFSKNLPKEQVRQKKKNPTETHESAIGGGFEIFQSRKKLGNSGARKGRQLSDKKGGGS